MAQVLERTVLFAVAWVVLLAIGEAVAGAVTIQDLIVAPGGDWRAIDAFNSRLRQDALVIYTPQHSSSTGTTDAHIELIVVAGTVVEIRPIGRNNAPIPEGGYVISAHGAAASWLRDNFKVGDRVEIRRHQVMGEPGTISRPVDRIGPNVTRGANELVVFTPGRARTGTNEWGIEAVVVDGVVVSVGGNDNPIPGSGFVLSGHGTARTWISDNVQVGAYVELTGNTVTVSFNAKSFLAQVRSHLAAVEERVAAAQDQGIPLPLPKIEALRREAEALSAQAEALSGGGDERAAIEHAVAALHAADKARLLSLPSAPVALRGVWYRPTEYRRDYIVSTLDRLVRAGINALFLETFWSGRVIYPSDLLPQRIEFRGWDPLAVWAEEAQARGIDLHLWVHVFRLGDYGSDPTLQQHPEWLASGLDSPVPSRYQAPRSWVDPAHPEARAFLLAAFEEMMTKYDVAGLHLDYIRYPRRQGSDTEYAVTDYSRRLFLDETGIDPVAAAQTGGPGFARWQEWKEEQITTFVAEVLELKNRVNPDLVLTAAVGPYLSRARYEIAQNWAAWGRHGYVSVIMPMLYSPGTEWVREGVEEGRHLLGEEAAAALVAGIGPYLGFAPDLLVEQVTGVHEAGSMGVVLFDLRSLAGDHMAALRSGPFRRDAVPPYRVPEALRALGRELEASLALAGGSPAVHEAAAALLRFSGAEPDSLVPLLPALQAALDELERAERVNTWQKGLLEQARGIVLLAESMQ